MTLAGSAARGASGEGRLPPRLDVLDLMALRRSPDSAAEENVGAAVTNPNCKKYALASVVCLTCMSRNGWMRSVVKMSESVDGYVKV